MKTTLKLLIAGFTFLALLGVYQISTGSCWIGIYGTIINILAVIVLVKQLRMINEIE